MCAFCPEFLAGETPVICGPAVNLRLSRQQVIDLACPVIHESEHDIPPLFVKTTPILSR
jgi:hypothetical protein